MEYEVTEVPGAWLSGEGGALYLSKLLTIRWSRSQPQTNKQLCSNKGKETTEYKANSIAH